MSDHNGFVDLRVGHGTQTVRDDNVWPSFTDIMTVIVIIFLMALVVIILKNIELEHKQINLEKSLRTTQQQRDSLQRNLDEEKIQIQLLKSKQSTLKTRLASLMKEWTALTEWKQSLLEQTEEIRLQFSDKNQDLLTVNQAVSLIIESNAILDKEKQSALEQVTVLSEKNKSLLNEKKVLTSEVTAAQQRITELYESEQILSSNIATAQEKISRLANTKTELNLKLDTALQEILTLSNSSQALTEVVANLSHKLSTLQLESEKRVSSLDQQNQLLNDKLNTLSKYLNDVEQLLTEAEVEHESLGKQLKQAHSLDGRYRSVVRPARSPAGKHVVEVWLLKTDTGLGYQYRVPGQNVMEPVSKEALHAVLLNLKETHGKQLYTQVIIPRTTDVSHSEAWKFTLEILQKYDYYYQQ